MPVITSLPGVQVDTSTFATPNFASQSRSEELDDMKNGIFRNAGVTDRLRNSGLPSGGMMSPDQVPTTVEVGSGSATEWRVRCSISPNATILYHNAGIMSPLKSTNGVIFPYTPSVTVQHTARYSSQPLTHSNYNNFFYEGSEVSSINITGEFTVQNQNEAKYFLAALYFFRAVTKMFYGDSGKYQGSPPPIVYLDGYGAHYLPHVPCVVTSFQHTMPPDVDYIDCISQYVDSGGTVYDDYGNPVSTGYTPNSGANRTRVPTYSQFIISFQPVYSRAAQRKFNYDSFSRGDLLSGGYL